MVCDVCGSPVNEKSDLPLEPADRWILVEKVPSRVCRQCGERIFDADTVEKLQAIA